MINIFKEDSIVGFFWKETFKSKFFRYLSHTIRLIPMEKSPHKLVMYSIFLSDFHHELIRTVYDINEFLSDIGGVMRVMIFATGLVLYPITKHQFYTILTKRLFLARTWDKNKLVPKKKYRSRKGRSVIIKRS